MANWAIAPTDNDIATDYGLNTELPQLVNHHSLGTKHTGIVLPQLVVVGGWLRTTRVLQWGDMRLTS